MDGLKEQTKDSGKKVSTTGLDLALNVGLRGVFAKAHGVELAARVPFMATTMFDAAGVKATCVGSLGVTLG